MRVVAEVIQTALITGVTGQDGVFLARHLIESGYNVVGTRRPGSSKRLLPYLSGVQIHDHDVRDIPGFQRLLDQHSPAEVYNLAGFTSVGASWGHPHLVNDVNAVAVEGMLEVLTKRSDIKYFQASSSEIFGTDADDAHNEHSPHRPTNPYGQSKSRAHLSTRRYRDEFGLFACSGVLYNHESPLRSTAFVTRKIVRAAAEIAAGTRTSVTLGNLDVSRDWGAARDYVVAMHAAMIHHSPSDYILATGTLHTLADLVNLAFEAAGLTDAWSYIEQDPALVRATDSPGLRGNPHHAASQLGWRAQTSFADVVADMVEVDLVRIKSGIEEAPSYLGLRPIR